MLKRDVANCYLKDMKASVKLIKHESKREIIQKAKKYFAQVKRFEFQILYPFIFVGF